MSKVKIKTETLPNRCDVCHQADEFDATNNFCKRCSNIDNKLVVDSNQANNSNKENDIFKRINANLNNGASRTNDDSVLFDYLIWWAIKLGIIGIVSAIVGVVVIHWGTILFRRFPVLSKVNLLSAFILLFLFVFIISGRVIFSFTIIDKLITKIFGLVNKLLNKEE